MSERQEIPILSILPAKQFHSCVLTTYSFDFNYFNHDGLAGLRRAGVRNICAYVDDSMLQQYLGNVSGYTSGLGKSYSLSSISRKGAFHPKISLFFGRDEHGFLIIGSGNLTAAGHGNNQELWGAFHINGPKDPKAPLFKHAWEYIKNIGNEVPGMSMRKLEWIETQTPWLRDIKRSGQPLGFEIDNGIKVFFLTNTGEGILHDLKSIVKEDVLQCTVISPFFDKKASVLFELERLYHNAQIHVIVQPDTLIGDFSDKDFERVQFYDWDAIVQEKRRRYLHAKLLHIRTISSEYCLLGSANLTAPALGTADISPSNEEVCLLFKRDEGNWLEEIGLGSKGDVIPAAKIFNKEKERSNKVISSEQCRFRLKAIDKINTHLWIYVENNVTVQNAFLVLFDGWGEEKYCIGFTKSEFKENTDYYDIFADKVPEEVLYGQLFDDKKTAISNKQVINDIVALSHTNPDPNTQRLEEVLDRIESSDGEMIEILTYLDPDDLTDEKLTRTGRNGGKEKKESTSDGTEKILPYDEFTKISLKDQVKDGISYFYGTHRIERILDTLKTILDKLKISDIDISNQDEEADIKTIESSTGRIDEEPHTRQVSPKTLSTFASLQKTVVRFFNQYIAIMDKQLLKKEKHRVNVIDASMFTIALHLLLNLLDKPIRVINKTQDEEYEEILLKADGGYFNKEDYCKIVTDIIGKFTMLLLNGIDDANDEYVKQRIKKCQEMAFWNAVCCIARLVPFKCNDKNFAENWLVWKLELALNLRYYFAPDDADNEIVALEEIKNRLKIQHYKNDITLLTTIFNSWRNLENRFQYFKNQYHNEKINRDTYNKGSLVFSKHIGFSHLIKVELKKDGIYKGQHMVSLARVGYPPSKSDIWDFEDGKTYIAEIGKIEVFNILE